MKRKRNSAVKPTAPTPPIGIDLGTTFSSVSVYRNGKAEIISTKKGDRRIPSIVYYDPVNGMVSVGREAKELMQQCPENAITDVKRIIGRNYDDDFVSSLCQSKQTSSSFVAIPDYHAGFQVTIGGSKVVRRPEEVAAHLFKYLKNIASVYLGSYVSEAVISVPAYFSVAQRFFTKKAAESVDLKVLRLVSEPAAAAVHYTSLCKQNKKTNLLVFDLGGGVLDVSVIEIDENRIEVKAVNGDTVLGGRNFDEILFDHFHEDFLPKNSEIPPKDKHELMNKCIELKEKLSKQQCVSSKRDSARRLSMTREKFEELSKDTFQRCLELVKLCLSDAGISKSCIDEVVLMGGSTKIPKIREILKSYFKAKPLNLNLNLCEAVAAGAGTLAASLKDNPRQPGKYTVKEVTPFSLGLEVLEKSMLVLIPKNSTLPATASDTLCTTVDNQTTVPINIFEGERKNTTYNNLLIRTTVSELDSKPAGDVTIKVTFALDEDGLLTFRGTQGALEKELKCSLWSMFGLCERRMTRTVRQKTINQKEDEVFQEFCNARSRYHDRCNDICNRLNKLSQCSDRFFIETRCNNFIAHSKNFQFTEIHELDEAFKNFMASIDELLKNNKLDELQYVPARNTCYYSLRSRNVPYHLPE